MKFQITDITTFDQILTAGDIVLIANRMLGCINKEISEHTVRTAFITLSIAENFKSEKAINLNDLMLLCCFHTLGFYREDANFNYNPHSSSIDFFTNNKAVRSKYVFSSLYLQYMTSLKDIAKSILNFTDPYNANTDNTQNNHSLYKDIIYFSARLCDFIKDKTEEQIPQDPNEIAPGFFNPKVVEVFNRQNKNNILIKKIKTNNYRQKISEFLFSLEYPPAATKQLEILLVFFLDFKSTQTMKHAVNTSCYAVSLGLRAGLSQRDLSSLFTSAALHDIGKIATPARILEYPGKLSPEDMGIMRHHVNHSKRILSGLVSYDILYNVYRHHEKLDRTGYPCHIDGKELTLSQRILTVADITSALNDSRSYKEEFTKEETISILKKMTESGELDANITKFVIEDFDAIVNEQKTLQEILRVDFSKVISEYNTYLLNLSAADSCTINSDTDNSEELEELLDFEEL